MEKNLGLNKPTDLKNWAYETIKKSILNLEVKGGEQLRIEELAEQMGISRTPVREALLKLESEGIVRAASRVGFFVAALTKRDFTELFERREILESYAAEKAVNSIEEQDLRQLEELQQKATAAVEEGNLTAFMETEIAIHALILRKANNARLARMIESIKDLIQRERIISLKSADNVRKTHQEHGQIISALQQRDAKLAASVMRSHLAGVKARLIRFLDLQ